MLKLDKSGVDSDVFHTETVSTRVVVSTYYSTVNRPQTIGMFREKNRKTNYSTLTAIMFIQEEKNFDVIFVNVTCPSMNVADSSVDPRIRRLYFCHAVIFSVGRRDENVNATDTCFQCRFNAFRITAYQSPRTARVDFHGFWCII